MPDAIESLLRQDYPGDVEIIVADGSDTPATANMLRDRYPSVQVVANPERIIPTGLNYALAAATGDIVMRCDSHSRLPSDYARRAVATLARTGAANVGGVQRPVGETMFERAVAMATSNILGTGAPRYRSSGPEGPTDTVYLGAWRRETLEEAGGFNTALLANEDYELNVRLRLRGLTVWFDPGLTVHYRPRGTVWELARQYFGYGRWKAAALLEHRSGLRARQLAPPLLALGLLASAGLAVAGMAWALALPLAYAAALCAGAAAIGVRRRDWAAVLIPVALATIHLSWGVGFFLPPRKRKKLVS